MKMNLPVSGIEEDYSASVNILTTTDLKGTITYVNDDFVSISGFKEDELVGKNHNVVRHPDIPEAAFADLWGNIKEKHSWMGIVKNRCKNGNHYWVDAYVSPIIENGKLVEYQSVRRKPSRDKVNRAENLYKKINEKKRTPMLKDKLGLVAKIIFMILFLSTLFGASLYFLELYSLPQLAPLAVFPILIAAAVWLMTAPYRRVIEKAKKVSSNPIARYVYTGRNDDLGWLELAMIKLESDAVGIVGRLSDASKHLSEDAQGMAVSAEQTNQDVGRQFAETEQVAAAVTQMSASVQQVADHAQQTVCEAEQASIKAGKGITLVDDTVEHLSSLSGRIQDTANSVRVLASEAEGISAIVNTITDIADKTNLLALNAAIEAARAGEQGRGFAVVADEVRELAVRTREATSEIESMVSELQSRSQSTVKSMEDGASYAQRSVEHAAEATSSLTEISQAMDVILSMNQQVADAVEQQSEVAEDINRSICEIRTTSEHTRDGVKQNEKASGSINLRVVELEMLANQFWGRQRARAAQ